MTCAVFATDRNAFFISLPNVFSEKCFFVVHTARVPEYTFVYSCFFFSAACRCMRTYLATNVFIVQRGFILGEGKGPL